MIGSVDITIVVMLPESDSAASHENDSSRWVGWEVVQPNVFQIVAPGPGGPTVQALLAASQMDDDDDVRFHAAVALGMLGATSKVARCRSNGHSRQHVPTVLA